MRTSYRGWTYGSHWPDVPTRDQKHNLVSYNKSRDVLEEGASYLEDHIFRKKGWRIYKAGEKSYFNSMVYHVGCTDVGRLVCPPLLRRMCVWCKNYMPEEVEAIWMLHNFDKIQEIQR